MGELVEADTAAFGQRVVLAQLDGDGAQRGLRPVASNGAKVSATSINPVSPLAGRGRG